MKFCLCWYSLCGQPIDSIKQLLSCHRSVIPDGFESFPHWIRTLVSVKLPERLKLTKNSSITTYCLYSIRIVEHHYGLLSRQPPQANDVPILPVKTSKAIIRVLTSFHRPTILVFPCRACGGCRSSEGTSKRSPREARA